MNFKRVAICSLFLCGCSSMDSVMRRMAFDTTLKVVIEKPNYNDEFKNKTILLNSVLLKWDGQPTHFEDKYQSFALERLKRYYPNSKLGISENLKTQLNNYLTGRLPQKKSEFELDVEINVFSSMVYPNLKSGEYSINTTYKIIETKTGNIVSIGNSIVTSAYSDAIIRSTEDAIIDLASLERSVSFPDAGFDETPEAVIAMINSKRQTEAIQLIREKINATPENEPNLLYLNALIEISKGNQKDFETLLMQATSKGYSRVKASEALSRSQEVMRIIKK